MSAATKEREHARLDTKTWPDAIAASAPPVAPRRANTAGATLLFWLMTVAGGAVLAPSLILPAWFEYEAAHERAVDAARRARELETVILSVQKRQEALLSDPAYMEREARKEFGLTPPGIEVIPVTPAPAPEFEPLDEFSEIPPALPPGPLPDLSEFVERTMQKYPLTTLFVRAETRPILLALGGGLFAAAVLLFGGLFAPRAAPRKSLAAGDVEKRQEAN